MKWNTGEPPKRKVRPVRLKVVSGFGNHLTGDFVWSDMEKTFVQCDIEEGVGLYADDGWKILGWRNP